MVDKDDEGIYAEGKGCGDIFVIQYLVSVHVQSVIVMRV